MNAKLHEPGVSIDNDGNSCAKNMEQRASLSSNAAQDISERNSSTLPSEEVGKSLLKELQVGSPNSLVRHLSFVPDEYDLDALVISENIAGCASRKRVSLFYFICCKPLLKLLLFPRPTWHMNRGRDKFARGVRLL